MTRACGNGTRKLAAGFAIWFISNTCPPARRRRRRGRDHPGEKQKEGNMTVAEKVTLAKRKKLAEQVAAANAQRLAAEKKSSASKKTAALQEIAAAEEVELRQISKMAASAEDVEAREAEDLSNMFGTVANYSKSPPWVLPIFWGTLAEQLAAEVTALGMPESAGDAEALLAACRREHILAACDRANRAAVEERLAFERAWRLASLAGKGSDYATILHYLPTSLGGGR